MSDSSTAEEEAATDATLEGQIAEYMEAIATTAQCADPDCEVPYRHAHRPLTKTEYEKQNHLWVQNQSQVVCTGCGLTLEDWKKGTPHDE